jgi:outer membrane protein OmpA-like peptidoglycan-associated protein/outer membrane murein-binding lipoprotein Lpp
VKERNMKKYTTVSVAAIVSAVLLAGCASMPKRMAELDQAHSTVETLAADPLAQQAASEELSNARKSLESADAAFKKGKKDEVLHYSYLASQQAQTGQERVAEMRSKQEVAQGEAERNRVLLESRTREAEAAKATAEAQARTAQAQAQQAEAARQEAEAAQRQLAELQAKQTERGMVLTLGDVLFDTAQATLKPGAGSVLDRVAAFLKENEGTKIIVEGHTDSRGSDDYNQQLSERRAQSVSDALAFRGIDRSRVEAVGRGKALPVASNDTAAGQQQNRRVELIFSDASGRFASGASPSLR